jgi:hypothetical protein
MANYRFYHLNPKGQILTREDADCDYDAHAYGRARAALGTDGEAEMWIDRRLLGRVRPRSSASS